MELLSDVGKEELMRKGIKDIVGKFDICFTCRKVFNHFICACGITLVLSFFSENIENYTRENIVAMVAMIFLFICIFDFTYSIMFTVGEYRVGDAGKAKCIETTVETDKNKKIIAVHEAGHAVMAYLKNAGKFDVNMRDGYVTTDYFLVDAQKHRDHIMIVYAGAIAEELVFGYFTTGSFGTANADFENATKMIKEYIVMTDQKISKTLLEEMTPDIISISKEIYAESEELLKNHKNMILRLADILMTKDFLGTEEVREVLLSSAEN